MFFYHKNLRFIYNFCRVSKGFFVISVVFIKNIDCKVKKIIYGMIKKCSEKLLDKLNVPNQIVPIVRKRKLLVVLPFLVKFSLNLRKRLYKSVSMYNFCRASKSFLSSMSFL